MRAHLVIAQFLRQRERRSTKGHGTFVLVPEHGEAPEVREHAQLGALVRHSLGEPLGRDEVLARARLVAPQPAVFAQHHLRSGGIVHVACEQHLASAEKPPVAGEVDIDARLCQLEHEPRPIRIVLRRQHDSCLEESRGVGERIQGDGAPGRVAQRDARAAD